MQCDDTAVLAESVMGVEYDSRFRVLFPIYAYQDVLGFRDGKIVAGDQNNGGEGYDDESPDEPKLLECCKCGHRWEMPSWMQDVYGFIDREGKLRT